MLTAYDAVVIGAGHNGLTAALYLQRAGLKTLVVEQAEDVGGMARTEEAPALGYRHNPHANYLAYGQISRVERDFDLAAAGLVTVTPLAQHGLAFADGRPPLVLHRRDHYARSGGSLRRYSRADAETYLALKIRVDDLAPLMEASLYSPPGPEIAASLIKAAARVCGTSVGTRSAKVVIDDLFESNEVRTLFYQLAAETGLMLEAEGSGLGFLTFTLWLVGQWRLPVGGMQSYADALAAAARREGVEIANRAHVERIVVRGGRAAGVILAGLGHVVARRAIVSGAGLIQTLMGFLPPRTISPRERARLGAYMAQDGPSLGSLALALAAKPDYRSARWDPEINRCFRTVVGYEDAASALEHLRVIGSGRLPEPAAALRVNTLWDGAQAPVGRHVAGGDVLMPAPGTMKPATWKAVADSFVRAFVEAWTRYAPNMQGKVTAGIFAPPLPYDRAILLGEGLDQYRTAVERLYLCGASTYPGGGVHGACGYNAFTAIAADLGLPGRR